MSAFMCSPETLYLISDELFTLHHIRELLRLKILPSKDPLSIEREDIFDVLYKMNRAALVARYGEDPAEALCGYSPDEGYLKGRRHWGEKEPEFPDILLYYRLGCYLYQCDEGKISDTPLYKYLCKIKTEIACHIVESSNEYQSISIDEWN